MITRSLVVLLCLVGGTAHAVTQAEEEAAFPELIGAAQKGCDPKRAEPELCKRIERFGRAKGALKLPASDRVLVTRIHALPDDAGDHRAPARNNYLVLVLSDEGTRLRWFVTWPENDAEKAQIEAVAQAVAQGKPLPEGSFAQLVEQQKSVHKAMPILTGYGGRYVKLDGAPGCLVLRRDGDSLYAFTLQINFESGGTMSLAWLPLRSLSRAPN